MGADKYNQPAQGTEDWHTPINENFRDLGIEVTDEVQSFTDLPAPDPNETASNGAPRKILVRDSRVIYRDTGDGWAPVAGLGTDTNPVPGRVFHEEHETGVQVIDGSRVYVQDTEPTDAVDGDVWIDTSQ